MNNKKSRSSLKKVIKQPDEEVETVRIKRRISFSGKKFIREFDTEEKPREYDNSYEISDHTNGEDSSGQSHGSIAATALQSTVQWSVHNDADKENLATAVYNDADKENLASALNPLSTNTSALVSEQNYPLSDFRLNFQTSINVTLFPDEQGKHQRRTGSLLRSEITQDSLSLNDTERKNLQDKSVYKMPVFEKTMDLMPQNLSYANHEMENIPPPLTTSTNHNVVEATQKTVVFENKDMSCDFSDIEPREVNKLAEPVQNISMDFLGDDSTLSSPLIPMDVISENRISKKLNFFELNEELNAGRIQLFPNGPKTPTTDRKAKHRFWHGLEQKNAENEAPPREAIKPRGTLNFNESMMMSPVTQKPEVKQLAPVDNTDQATKPKRSLNAKRNYRFSQADELMLDNTNFLAHAKIGDETQSRNSSKCSSRRETTYDNTGMELDDLEKREAAVKAALEQHLTSAPMQPRKNSLYLSESIAEDLAKSKVQEKVFNVRRQTLNLVEPMDEVVEMPLQGENIDSVAPREQQQSRRRETLLRDDAMDEDSFCSKKENKSSVALPKPNSHKQRATLLMTQPIEEDIAQSHKPLKPQHVRTEKRQTIHMSEVIETENVEPQTRAPDVQQKYTRRRQTLLQNESIEEITFPTEKEPQLQKAAAERPRDIRPRPTLLLDDSIKGDSFCSKQFNKNHHEPNMKGNETIEETLKPDKAGPEILGSRRRQTVHRVDPIEEDSIVHSANSNPYGQEIFDIEDKRQPQSDRDVHETRRRQAVHRDEPIEEDSIAPIASYIHSMHRDLAIEEAIPDRERRQTIRRDEPIEGDSIAPIASYIHSMHRDLAIEEAIPDRGRRQTVHRVAPTDEHSIAPIADHKHTTHKDLTFEETIPGAQHTQSQSGLQQHGRRQTVHRVDPIEEDSIVHTTNRHPQMDITFEAENEEPQDTHMHKSSADVQGRRRRQTILQPDPILEDSIAHTMNHQKRTQQREEAKDPISKNSNGFPERKPRQTIHGACPIEEESEAPNINRKLSAQRDLRFEEEVLKKPNCQANLPGHRRRQTILQNDSILEDSIAHTTYHQKHTLQKDLTFEEEVMDPKAIESRRELPEHKRRQTVYRDDPIEEETLAPNINRKHRDLRYEEELHEHQVKRIPNPAAHLPGHRRRQTILQNDSILEDSIAHTTIPQKQPLPGDPREYRNEPIEEETLAPNMNRKERRQKDLGFVEEVHEPQEKRIPNPAAHLPGHRRRQTILQNDSILEDSIAHTTIPQKHALPGDLAFEEKAMESVVELPGHIRRQTEYRNEPIEEDFALAPANQNINKEVDSPPRAPSQGARRRPTVHQIDAIEEDSFCSKPSGIPVYKHPAGALRKTLHMAEAIDVEQLASPVPPTLPSKKPSNKTILISESFEEDFATETETKLKVISNAEVSASVPAGNSHHHKKRQTHNKEAHHAIEEEAPKVTGKPRQTVHHEESMDMEMSITAPVKQRLGKLRVASLRDDSLQTELLRRTLDKGHHLNRLATSTSVGTPENKKRSNFFAITPGRSMIEYENLEMECKSESPPEVAVGRTINQADFMELDMDTSNFGTPQQKTSGNSKRLPIHLTPNLPQPKKRNWQRPLEESIQKENMSVELQQLSPLLTREAPEELDGTVQVVRAQMMRQTISHRLELPQLMENKLKINGTAYEDNPITISDVSNHFKAQRESAEAAEQQSKESSMESRSSTKPCNKSYATVQKKYMNLSSDTEIIGAALEPKEATENSDIDKTRLSLVSTLLDEDEAEQEEDVLEASRGSNVDKMENAASETCLEQLNPPAMAGTKDSCKKCKHCRRSLDRTLARRSIEETFVLPEWPDLDVQLQRLERLDKQPRLSDVNKYWELKKLELIYEDNEGEMEEETKLSQNSPSVSRILQLFDNKWTAYQRSLPLPKPVETFADRLKAALDVRLPNWIFDYNLQFYRKYIFSHRKVTTFQICIDYEPLDTLETQIHVNSVQIKPRNSPPMLLSKLYEDLTDFQLRLNLPLNLPQLLDGNNMEDVLKFLEHVDRVCLNVYNMCKIFKVKLLMANAELIRESNRFVVRKTLRKGVRQQDYLYACVEKTILKVQVGNLQKISFEDILQPPLYQIEEKIQFLPKGIQFLEALLQDPLQYLKQA